MRRPTRRALRISDRLYRRLVRLYPAAYRQEYGEPMAQLFRDCCAAECSVSGYRGLALTWWRALAELVPSLLREYRQEWSTGAPRAVTPRARRSLAIALHQARSAGRREITPDDVLRGLSAEPEGVAGRVLRGLPASRPSSALSGSAPARLLRGSRRATAGLLRSAEAEARRLGHSYVGTEHLLLALLRSDSPALQALLGVSAESVELEVGKLIGPRDA